MAPPASRLVLTRVISRLSSLRRGTNGSKPLSSPLTRIPEPSPFSTSALSKTTVLSNTLPSGASGLARLSPARFSFGSHERQFSSAKDRELGEILKSEVEHEKESFEVPEEVRKGPPRPFKVDDVRGSGEIILRRSFENEDISVVVGLQPDEYPEMEPDEDGVEEEAEQRPRQAMGCIVRVVKDADQPCLEFHMTVEEDSWYISSVLFDNKQGEPERIAYGGPDFGTLDDRLQALFDKYLFQRGFNSDLAQYLRAAISAKEQREYVQWLEDVAKFISE